MLFIGLCVTEADWEENKAQLVASLANFRKIFSESVYIFCVFQHQAFPVASHELLPIVDDVHLTNVFSVSIARNLCIKRARMMSADHLIFHDASIYFGEETVFDIFLRRNSTSAVMYNARFNMSNERKHQRTINETTISTTAVRHPYVWTYIFPLIDILPQFDVNLGPGDKAKIKCGEDVCFLTEYFGAYNFEVSFIENRYVAHQPRPQDYSKHLYYAFYQGQMYKILIRSKYRCKDLFVDLTLFLSNACVRGVLVPSYPIDIFFQRIRGLFSKP